MEVALALVTKFEQHDPRSQSLHPTHVTCRYVLRNIEGRKWIQLDTYGSSTREMPDKLSQTVQFTEVEARRLWTVLGDHFGFSK